MPLDEAFQEAVLALSKLADELDEAYPDEQMRDAVVQGRPDLARQSISELRDELHEAGLL